MSKPHWHEFNPWADAITYVPLNALARCLHHLGERCQMPDGTTQIITVARQLKHWRQYGDKLDAYVLPQPSGQHSAGVRYGREPGEYISLYCDPKALEQLLEKYGALT